MLKFDKIGRFYIPSGEVSRIYVNGNAIWEGPKRYGYKREKANNNPSSRITYLYDATDMTPMSTNLSTGAIDYGDWEEFVNEICRPVMLKTDGTVDYELDHRDQTKKLDGSASDVANVNYDGNAMVEFRTYKWVKRYEDENYEYVIFSNMQIDDSYKAYAHTNANGVIQDAFYWGMFKGTYSNNKLRSIGTGSLMVSQTRESEILRAQANGVGTDMTKNGYYISYKSGWDYISDLLTLLAKNDNSQEAFGQGYCKSSNTKMLNAGTLTSKPGFCGYSDGTTDVKTLYIEGIWGNIWDQLAGFMVSSDSGFHVKMTPPYNTSASGYLTTGYYPNNSSSAFYVDTHSCTDEYGYIPKTTNGTSSTYMCDRCTCTPSGLNYIIIGGGYTNAGECGSRCMYAESAANAAATWIGARLTYLNPQ